MFNVYVSINLSHNKQTKKYKIHISRKYQQTHGQWLLNIDITHIHRCFNQNCVDPHVLIAVSEVLGSHKPSSRPMRRPKKGGAGSDVDALVSSKFYRRQRQKDKVAPIGIDQTAQTALDYIGEHLDVRYNVVGNDGGRFHVDIVLTNSGDDFIPSCCWSIYFYHMKYDLVLHYHTFKIRCTPIWNENFGEN